MGWSTGPDHPRIRGEHRRHLHGMVHGAGSSPHTRGALAADLLHCAQAGIIPAYAGSTLYFDKPQTRNWDHPRIRGEHRSSAPGWPTRRGSSPHTRGAPRPRWRSDGCGWIIPAYAGSTSAGGRRRSGRRDHPRIRGEHTRVGPALSVVQGSSPHTRGALAHHREGKMCRGIIPAYAGSTMQTFNERKTDGDHPRIRGEHISVVIGLVVGTGSSPHTRGARRKRPRMRGRRRDHPRIRGEHSPTPSGTTRRVRIIPAYAGSTLTVGEIIHLSPDHPRIRGEHMHVYPPVSRFDGSSPHTRGAHPDRRRLARLGGIIPAYAGSTFSFPVPGAFLPDHPRIRGEHSPTSASCNSPTGSSPHTRGARYAMPRESCLWRIIPAYAGSTSTVRNPASKATDHPRIRGEHVRTSRTFSRSTGSSPHTRGAPLRTLQGDI